MAASFDPEGAFTVSAARHAGFSRRDLDRPALERPFHGLRAVRRQPVAEGDEPAEAERRRAAIELAAERFAVNMAGHEFFSHTSAAVLWGIPLPLLDDERLHVSVRAPARAPRGSGVHGHQLAEGHVEVVRHPECHLRLTSPSSTWALLGVLLRHPYDLVAAADGVLHVDRVAGPRGWVKAPALATATELAAAIPPRRRGVRALREALPRARGGVASRTETWTRLTLVDAGLPEPITDLDVFSDRGEFIGCVDLAYPVQRVAVEYEGDQHRTSRDQWNRDLDKHEALARAGWRVIRVSSRLLFREPERLVASVRVALRHAG